jgi:hypothetical protein
MAKSGYAPRDAPRVGRKTATRGVALNTELLFTAIRVWGVEILVSGFNFFVLMQLIYEPLWGERTAHQIGMSTRIGYIFVFAYLLLRYARAYNTRDLVHIGALWLTLTLIFEWAGSILLLRRPVDDILVGWHIERGYMWPYVLLAYALSNLIVGTVLHPRRPQNSGKHAAIGTLS